MYVTLQPSGRPDGVLPYPFHVNADGSIGRQDFWRGQAATAIGFVNRPDSYHIALSWSAAVGNPQKAVGKYVVTADSKGQFSTHMVAIESVQVSAGSCA